MDALVDGLKSMYDPHGSDFADGRDEVLVPDMYQGHPLEGFVGCVIYEVEKSEMVEFRGQWIRAFDERLMLGTPWYSNTGQRSDIKPCELIPSLSTFPGDSCEISSRTLKSKCSKQRLSRQNYIILWIQPKF